ncbi:MAG: anti-sigma factor domain-containing protein [Terracidiphilus sp.]
MDVSEVSRPAEERSRRSPTCRDVCRRYRRIRLAGQEAGPASLPVSGAGSHRCACYRLLHRHRYAGDHPPEEFTVRPVAATAPPGKAYELWLIDPRIGAPRSLGVIAADSATRSANLAQYDRAVVEDATYAVTVEPPGGSPSGKPSGPPVFVGKLIPVGP